MITEAELRSMLSNDIALGNNLIDAMHKVLSSDEMTDWRDALWGSRRSQAPFKRDDVQAAFALALLTR